MANYMISHLTFAFLMQTMISCAICSKPSSCAEVLLQGNTQSGVYTVFPRGWFDPIPFQVYCDMETDGGGWTIFQRRDDYNVREDFFRKWNDYANGFGNLNREFWLGNDHLFTLTNQDYVTLRVDLEDFEGNKRYAVYNKFQVSNRHSNYKVSISEYSGDAGDSLTFNGANFVTIDRDVNNCAAQYKGGWWYQKCHVANLNGLYLKGNHSTFADGVNWKTWLGYHYSLKVSEMKIRPTHFLQRHAE